MISGSLSLTKIVEAQHSYSGIFPHWYVFTPWGFAGFVMFSIAAMAETNRSPFDLPEGESEIVAGFFVEYSSMSFALFFLGEYANMILMSAMTSLLFLGGWLAPFGLPTPVWMGPIWLIAKICFVLFGFLWVRATFPRYRYDQLMRLGWKVFLPGSLIYLVLVAGVLLAMGWLPHAA
jgi:NADH-quinone oxidoreductase subunit H